MEIKVIEFLANWIKENKLALKILSSKFSCTELETRELLNDLIISIKLAADDSQKNNKLKFKDVRETNRK